LSNHKSRCVPRNGSSRGPKQSFPPPLRDPLAIAVASWALK
jgi:hypothetical protein